MGFPNCPSPVIVRPLLLRLGLLCMTHTFPAGEMFWMQTGLLKGVRIFCRSFGRLLGSVFSLICPPHSWIRSPLRCSCELEATPPKFECSLSRGTPIFPLLAEGVICFLYPLVSECSLQLLYCPPGGGLISPPSIW